MSFQIIKHFLCLLWRKHDVKNLDYYPFVPASATDFPFATKIRRKINHVAFSPGELKLRLWLHGKSWPKLNSVLSNSAGVAVRNYFYASKERRILTCLLSRHITPSCPSGRDSAVRALFISSAKNAPWSRAHMCVPILKQGSKSSLIYTNVARQMMTRPVMSLCDFLTQEWLSRQAAVCSLSFSLQSTRLCLPQEPNVPFMPFHLEQVRGRHDQRSPKVCAAKVHQEDVFIFHSQFFPFSLSVLSQVLHTLC